MKDKLAEEILFGYRLKAGGMTEADMIEAMQAYHGAKLAEITDEDIEVWAEKEFGDSMVIPEIAAMAGAKAFRDGLIKHIDV